MALVGGAYSRRVVRRVVTSVPVDGNGATVTLEFAQ